MIESYYKIGDTLWANKSAHFKKYLVLDVVFESAEMYVPDYIHGRFKYKCAPEDSLNQETWIEPENILYKGCDKIGCK